MRTYDSYKDSGVEWISEIPSHWEVKRFKDCHYEVDEIVGSDWSEYSLLSLTKNGVVNRDIESGIGKFPESFETYKKVGFNDLIFCLYDIEETPRTVGLSKLNGMITGSYKIIKSINVIPEYTYYVYLTIDDSKGLKPYYTGLRNTVRTDTFNSIKYILPPLSEQEQIVSYLDEKTSLIDEMVEKKKRKIELLKEYRTSLINTVVTKGLNPDVPMKDSGIEWIGKIPRHWELKRLKHLSRIEYGISPPDTTYNDEGIGSVLINGPVEYSESDFGYTRSLKWTTEPKKFTRKGSLLFCLRGSTTGRLNITHDDVSIGRGVCSIYSNHNQWYLIYSMFCVRNWLSGQLSGSTFPSVTKDDVDNYHICNPPLSEQEQIVSYLDEKTSEIDKTIELENKKIELLKEYRQSLISKVVTGKIKVVSE